MTKRHAEVCCVPGEYSFRVLFEFFEHEKRVDVGFSRRN